ncbi:MFS transporter [Candidatus Acidianus copahuensis]|uniref:MFS transporter n=1 Tax=Candidatus Acidianus copahuensis TaxID=1160895 RepID=UPI00064E5932|nr:MFS transporter [Candidatus Acidianus copahuensis]
MSQYISKGNLLAIAIGYSLTFFDIFNVPYIINYSSQFFGLSNASILSNLVLVAEMVGYSVGGLVNGFLTTRLGRKKGVILSSMLIALGSLIGITSLTLIQLVISELIIGLGIEGEALSSISYLTETSPPKSRGKYIGFTSLFGFSMTLLVAPIALFLGTEWRLLFLPGILLGGIAIFMRLNLPESKAWIEGIGSRKIIEDLRRTGIFVLVWFLSYAAGYALFSSVIFSLISLKMNGESSLYFSYILYGDPLGVLIGSALNDKVERKTASILTNFLSGLLMIPWFFLSGSSFLVIGFLIMLTQGMKFPPMYSYTAEVIGTEIRSLGFGIADGIGHLGGAVGPIISVVAYSFSPYLGVISMSAFAISSSAFLFIMRSKTNGKPLDEIS